MEIDLGFAEECEDVRWLSNRYFPSKLGGHPAWLDVEALPTTQELLCNKCQVPKAFLCQLYAPYEDEYNFHRSIYVFVCCNAACQQPNSAENVTILRAQLSRQNKFYSEEDPIDEGEPLEEIPCLKALCAVCGCLGPHRCSKCKSINYCSAAHQRAHWTQHKPNCATGKSTETCEPIEKIEFPTYEIVMESSPVNSATLETEDSGAEEHAQLAEYEQMAASGKTGELSNVTEKELDKYFCNSSSVDDKTFQHFKKQTQTEPKQIVRYQRGGTPLWIANVAGTVEAQLQSLPKCSNCDGPRQFEFQIMPQMLTLLKDEHLDWGVLAVYTCAASCQISGYVEEHVIKQDIVAEQS